MKAVAFPSTHIYNTFVKNCAVSPSPEWENESVHPFPSVLFSTHFYPFPLQFFHPDHFQCDRGLHDFLCQGMKRHSLVLKMQPQQKKEKNTPKWSKP
jgi:hypothetical protein